MEDVLMPLLLILLIGVGGWVLGVVGFFQARRALAETRLLRLQLAAGAAPAPAAQPAFTPPVPPPVTTEASAVPQTPPAPQVPAGRPWDIEALLTLRWGVWLGSAALLFAGVFLVRYAVDEGLLGPATRCALAGLLGVALIAGADWLKRREKPEAATWTADQAPPALAAGGVAMLFGAAYAAGVLYGLVPPLAAFALMAAASLIGLVVSLRHGQLVAAVGIAGAFATPALVQSNDPSLPGLFAYLLFVTAAALAVVRYTAWVWLGWATTVAGAFWVVLATLSGSGSDSWAPALFVPAAAALNLALLPPAALDHAVGRRLAWVPFAVLAASGLLAGIVEPGWAPRAGVLLLSPLAVWKGATEPRLDRLPWLSALFFLLVLLTWALPVWQPTGEAITVEGVVQAILPGAWAPEVIVPLLQTAALMAAFYAAAGLWFERRAAHPLRWSALTAAVPVLTLAVTYAQVALFQPRPAWAAVAVVLAAALTGAARLSLDGASQERQRAGVHGAGVVACLALGCAMLLADQWLTLAVALFLPPLAWIEERAELPALRLVALAVAAFVLVRLLLNWYVPFYDFGATPGLNLLLPTYGVPALAFAWTARYFRRRADDLAVAVLEAGATAFTTALVVLEIRHWAGSGQPIGSEAALPGASFLEAGLQVSALGVLATAAMWLDQRAPRPVRAWAWRIQGSAALLGGVALLIGNPGFFGDPVGATPVLNALLPAYLIPALLAALAVRQPATTQPPPLRPVLGGYAVLAAFAWITLEVRHLFHPAAIGLDAAPIEDAELWAWSGAWLAFGFGLMAGGIRAGLKALRLAAIAVVGLTAAKVFMVDMAGLVGLWRVLSFLGLGLTLIGLGAVYRRFVQPPLPAGEA
jgi:uncharacterized membrane protein